MKKTIILIVVIISALMGINAVISSTGGKEGEAKDKPPTEVSKNAPGTRVLFDAIHSGDFKTAEKAMAKDPKLVNKPNPSKGTFLNCAVSDGNSKMVEFLLDHGADIDNTSLCGTSAMQLAISKSEANIVELLIKRGANINLVNRKGLSPLDQARQADEKAIVKILLDNGAKPASELPKPAKKPGSATDKAKSTKTIKKAPPVKKKGW